MMATNVLTNIIIKILADNCFQQFESLPVVHQMKSILSQPFPVSTPKTLRHTILISSPLSLRAGRALLVHV